MVTFVQGWPPWILTLLQGCI